MNFQGKGAISRPTRATGRTTLFLSLLLGLAGVGWIDVADNSLIGLKVIHAKFIPLLQLLCAIAAAHLVQWYSDYVSYRGWNVTGKLPGGSRWGAPNETRLQDIVDGIAVLPDGKEDLQRISSDLEKLTKDVDQIRWNMRSFDFFARFYVFGWHLLLPLASVGVAFYLNYNA
ncbi:hypothetical protein [uncultured Roseobacter sp.]|uniref:hypothetical protein n=1 Tax=uncultured Roseobacter sp. TaxID=114847 RepID=UPI00260ED8E2|nr:hypothetical protein [uncultured Roseobacter sp.]